MTVLRENLRKLATFAVAVLLIILGLTINLNTIKSWVFGTRIIVSSATRGQIEEYLAGEVLKLSLDGVQSSRVIWEFDEGQPVVGAVEAQYAFPFDRKTPTGQARDHRVDAFFKSGDLYKTASAILRTRNVNYTVTAGVSESGIVLNAPKAFESEWSLKSGSLTNFVSGKFIRSDPLTSSSTARAVQFVATPNQAKDTFGYTDATRFLAGFVGIGDQRAWTSYDFINKVTGAKLTIAKLLEPESQNESIYK